MQNRLCLFLIVISSILYAGCSAQKRVTDQQKPLFEIMEDPVFQPGLNGIATTRIPALILTKSGALLAFCEARINGIGDWADIDLLMRRSRDGGKTWEEARVVAPRKSGMPTSNITPIIDKKGVIHLLFQRNYASAYYIKSEDEGQSWSDPEDITAVFEKFRSEYNWKVLAPGPGHAIQLKSGRLVASVWLCEPDTSMGPAGKHRPSVVATIYSDDEGRTWNRGDIIAANTPEQVNPNESVLVELADGSVMINMRNETPVHRRLTSISPDGATAWTKPVFDTALYEPVVMASLIRVSGNGAPGKPRLLFVNPDSRNNPARINKTIPVFRARENLSAKLSYDEGKTWAYNKVLDPGKAGYSDLAVAPDGTVYCLYEIETRDGYKGRPQYKVKLLKFNMAWLTDGRDKWPANE